MLKRFTIIRRYEKCWILSLPSFGRRKIELIFAPAGYRVREHCHEQVDIELFVLFCGVTRFYRRLKDETVGITHIATGSSDTFRKFSIPAGAFHFFEVDQWPFIFINIEKWHTKPKSVIDDFIYA